MLPDFVVHALETTPKMTERYYFWTGAGNVVTAVRVWDTRLKRIFDQANVTRGHGHRFRDNFVVELFLPGVPMERVAVLLGHQSIRITEKHYAPWVRARQKQLEGAVILRSCSKGNRKRRVREGYARKAPTLTR